MDCQYCQNQCIKYGKQLDGTQRYFCKSCKRCQQKSYKYQAKIKTKRDLIIPMLLNNAGFTGIKRVLGITINSIMKVIFTAAENLQDPLSEKGCVYEIDEMRAYRKTGKDIWVCYALERKSGSITGLSIGKRDEITLRKTCNKVLMAGAKRIYTDGYGVYKTILPGNCIKCQKRCCGGWNVNTCMHVID